MSGNGMRPLILRPAARGSKKGWVQVVGKVPPEHSAALDQLAESRPAFRDDLVAEGIALLLKSEGLLAA